MTAISMFLVDDDDDDADDDDDDHHHHHRHPKILFVHSPVISKNYQVVIHYPWIWIVMD